MVILFVAGSQFSFILLSFLHKFNKYAVHFITRVFVFHLSLLLKTFIGMPQVYKHI